MIKVGVAILAMAGLVLATVNEPVVKVEVKGMHLCCGGCEGGAKGAVEGGGAKEATTDKGSGTLTFSVANDAAAMKALEKLAAAGFWGTIDSKTVADLMHLVQQWHWERRTVLAATHDIELVRAYFPQVLLLAREPVAWGATREVLTAENLDRARRMCEAFDDTAEACASEAA